MLPTEGMVRLRPITFDCDCPPRKRCKLTKSGKPSLIIFTPNRMDSSDNDLDSNTSTVYSVVSEDGGGKYNPDIIEGLEFLIPFKSLNPFYNPSFDPNYNKNMKNTSMITDKTEMDGGGRFPLLSKNDDKKLKKKKKNRRHSCVMIELSSEEDTNEFPEEEEYEERDDTSEICMYEKNEEMKSCTPLADIERGERPEDVNCMSEFVRYPAHSIKQVIISMSDMCRLRSGAFLNDNIIDLYLKYMYNEIFSEKQRRSIHIFSSFFYNKLSASVMKSDVKSRLKLGRWTRNLNIFEKQIVIVPINEHLHWSLAIITIPGFEDMHLPMIIMDDDDAADVIQIEIEEEMESEENDDWIAKWSTDERVLKVIRNPMNILHFDSMRGCHESRDIYNNLRIWLNDEWKRKHENTNLLRFSVNSMPGINVGILQQRNCADCGVFLLHFAEIFCLTPFFDSGGCLSRNHWFPHSHIYRKRRNIRHILIELRSKQGLPLLDIDYILNRLRITIESQSGYGIMLDNDIPILNLPNLSEINKSENEEEDIVENVSSTKSSSMDSLSTTIHKIRSMDSQEIVDRLIVAVENGSISTKAVRVLFH